MSSIFITHGGGPLPLLKKEQHMKMYQQFDQIHHKYPNPTGIVIFSAHWEQKEWTILDQDCPTLYYDYEGFSEAAYKLKYFAKSTGVLREHIVQTLSKQGIQLKRNHKRGYDHGVFVPLMIMYPQANIPVIQISILQSMSPKKHFVMGEALTVLKKEGYLIIGSGSSVLPKWTGTSASRQFRIGNHFHLVIRCTLGNSIWFLCSQTSEWYNLNKLVSVNKGAQIFLALNSAITYFIDSMIV